MDGHYSSSLAPIQTPEEVIKVFRITKKLQADEYLSGLELNSAGQWRSKTEVAHPCSKYKYCHIKV